MWREPSLSREEEKKAERSVQTSSVNEHDLLRYFSTVPRPSPNLSCHVFTVYYSPSSPVQIRAATVSLGHHFLMKFLVSCNASRK